jgi:hypothetical protein
MFIQSDIVSNLRTTRRRVKSEYGLQEHEDLSSPVNPYYSLPTPA